MKFFSLIFSLSLLNVLFANDDYLINEQFSNNSNNWPVVKTKISKASVNAGRGVYILQYKSEYGNLAVMKTTKLDEDRDFKIEALLYKEKGVENYGYGLIFGGREDNYYSLLIAGTGYYIFGKVEDGGWQDISPDGWIYSEQVQPGNKKYNLLGIVKIGNTLHFEINSEEVGRVTAPTFFGNKIGFNVNDKQTILVDWITVEYLD